MKKTIFIIAVATLCLTALFASCAKDSHYIIDEVVDVSRDQEKINILYQHVRVPGTDQNIDLVVVLKGTFTMGADYYDGRAHGYERPQHPVTISKDFAFATVPVTQALYEAVMDTNPVRTWVEENPQLQGFLGPDKPVVWICYDDAEEFCRRLSALTGKTFNLPTEAQWEYVARGGHVAQEKQTLYAGSDKLDRVGWYYSNTPIDTVVVVDSFYYEDYDTTLYFIDTFYNRHVMPVREKSPNILEIYDMSGNSWEWCRGYYYDYNLYYPDGVVDPLPLEPDPTYVARVRRGGAWNTVEDRCRLSNRFLQEVEDLFVTDSTIGFRVMMEL